MGAHRWYHQTFEEGAHPPAGGAYKTKKKNEKQVIKSQEADSTCSVKRNIILLSVMKSRSVAGGLDMVRADSDCEGKNLLKKRDESWK